VIEWLAVVIGLAGGAVLSLTVVRALSRRARQPRNAIKFGFGGAVIAALPALMLSIVVGATLGTPWGLPGVAIGVALVFALVLLAGVFGGVLLARYFT
jgi:hypothetical protein